MMLAFGVGFEFPILLVFLQLAGSCSFEQLRSWRRYAIVGIVVLVAVITPSGDPISLAALLGPHVLLLRALDPHRPRPIAAGARAAAETLTEPHGSPSTRFQRRGRSPPSTGASRSWSPPRPARARRSWPSTPSSVALAEPAGRVFYTTPIKALSNQKYGDLVRRHGRRRGRAC